MNLSVGGWGSANRSDRIIRSPARRGKDMVRFPQLLCDFAVDVHVVRSAAPHTSASPLTVQGAPLDTDGFPQAPQPRRLSSCVSNVFRARARFMVIEPGRSILAEKTRPDTQRRHMRRHAIRTCDAVGVAAIRRRSANADADALAGRRADASKRWGADACRASTVWRSGHASLAHGRRRWRAVVVHCGTLVPRGPLNSAYASRRTCHRFFCNADTAFGERGMR